MTPHDGESGTLEYVKYEGVTDSLQDLGVYLPANYDAKRVEPYKVIYEFADMGGFVANYIASIMQINLVILVFSLEQT